MYIKQVRNPSCIDYYPVMGGGTSGYCKPARVLVPVQVIIQGFRSYRDQTIVDPFSPRHNVISEYMYWCACVCVCSTVSH